MLLQLREVRLLREARIREAVDRVAVRLPAHHKFAVRVGARRHRDVPGVKQRKLGGERGEHGQRAGVEGGQYKVHLVLGRHRGKAVHQRRRRLVVHRLGVAVHLLRDRVKVVQRVDRAAVHCVELDARLRAARLRRVQRHAARAGQAVHARVGQRQVAQHVIKGALCGGGGGRRGAREAAGEVRTGGQARRRSRRACRRARWKWGAAAPGSTGVVSEVTRRTFSNINVMTCSILPTPLPLAQAPAASNRERVKRRPGSDIL